MNSRAKRVLFFLSVLALPHGAFCAVSFNNNTSNLITLPVGAATGTIGTVTAWFNSNSIGVVQNIVSASATADITHNFRLDINAAGNISIITNNGGTANTVRGNTVVSSNTWNFFAVTSDGSSYSLFVNGSQETVTTTTGLNNGLWFGGIAGLVNHQIGLLTRTSAIIPFNGSIDDVREYSRVLSLSELKSLALSRSRLLITDGCRGIWSLDDGIIGTTGGTVRDRCKGTFPGTLTIATWAPGTLNYP